MTNLKLKKDLLETIVSDCDPDMSDKAVGFYKEFFGNYFDGTQKINPYFRGDCMNSLGWTFGAENKEGTFNSYARSYTRLFTEEDIGLFYQFRAMYHSKSNFIVLPRKLNVRRGLFVTDDNDNYGHGTCDYFDILLSIIRKYYLKEDMTPRMRSYVDPYKSWLDSYGSGDLGWKAFIERNYLAPFVTDEYLVKDLFADNGSYKSPNCDKLIGAYHDFDWSLPRCSKNAEKILLKTAKERAVNYMQNCLWVWDERSSDMSEA